MAPLLAACVMAPTSLPATAKVPPTSADASPSGVTETTSGTSPSAPSSPTGTPANAGELRLTVAGDFGSTSATTKVLGRVGEIRPDANLMLGDLSYGKTGEEAKWCSYAGGLTGDTPNYLVAGNHEANGEDGLIDDFITCMPAPGKVQGAYAQQYWVDLPAKKPLVRVIFISPGVDFGEGRLNYDQGTARYQWTADAIDDARADGIPWVFVGTHKLCISAGKYGCEVGRDITRLLLDRHVDLAFTGHEHIYQRSKQLAAGVSGCPELVVGRYAEACVSDADDQLTAGAGTVFVTVGTGGTRLRNLSPRDSEAGYFRSWSAGNREPSHGFVSISLSKNELSASFDNAGTGGFTDSFTISRR